MMNFYSRGGIGDLLTIVDVCIGTQRKHKDMEFNIRVPNYLMGFRGTDYKDLFAELGERMASKAERKITFEYGDYPAHFWAAGVSDIDDVGFKVNVGDRTMGLKWRNARFLFENYDDVLCSEINPVSGDYAVITTRLRFMHKRKLDRSPEDLLDRTLEILLERYSKLVVIGEKTANNWERDEGDEKNGLDPAWPSLLPKILDFVERHPEHKSRVIDMTTPTISIDNFLMENKICTDAKRVVCFGHGGNYARQLYISSNSLTLMGSVGWDHPVTKIYRMMQKEKGIHPQKQIIHKNNADKFLERL
jgi:hypothetical protein